MLLIDVRLGFIQASENIETFNMKLRWSKSLRLLQRATFLVILCFEWKIGKFENVRIFIHYIILIKASKKERNHYDLKEIENYCVTKTFSKRLAKKNPSLYSLINGQRINGGQEQGQEGVIDRQYWLGVSISVG